MAMTERALALEEASSFEQRQIRVLNGSAARSRADAKRIDGVALGLAVIAVFVYMLGLAFISARITSAGAEINSLNAQIAELENQSSIADMSIGAKSSLERIESYAIAELGMVYPNPDETYFLSAESSLNIAQGRQALEAPAPVPEETESSSQTDVLSRLSTSVSGWLGLHAARAAENTD